MDTPLPSLTQRGVTVAHDLPSCKSFFNPITIGEMRVELKEKNNMQVRNDDKNTM